MSIIVTDRPRILGAPKTGKTSKAKKDKQAKEMLAINLLVDMDRRHKQYLGSGDRQGLIELAGEYMLLGDHGGCPGLASRILVEAENLQLERSPNGL